MLSVFPWGWYSVKSMRGENLVPGFEDILQPSWPYTQMYSRQDHFEGAHSSHFVSTQKLGHTPSAPAADTQVQEQGKKIPHARNSLKVGT